MEEEIQALRASLRETVAERDKLKSELDRVALDTAIMHRELVVDPLERKLKVAHEMLVHVERFLLDCGPLDLPAGCTQDGNPASLAFRASCTIIRLRQELAAAKEKP